MPKTGHFSPRLFAFLRDLKKNNDRAWFNAHKERYEADVKTPLLAFISDFAPRLQKISPHYIADPRPNGGSMFRIYRDTRFSKDKSPYKTHAAVHFRHADGKNVHAPGFYLHLEPRSVFIGVGIWHPESKALLKIRSAIRDDPTGWRRAKSAKAFTSRFSLRGDSLKRPPAGFEPDHPLIEDLRRKDFIAVAELNQADAVRPDFLTTFSSACRSARPFVAFLTKSLDLSW